MSGTHPGDRRSLNTPIHKDVLLLLHGRLLVQHLDGLVGDVRSGGSGRLEFAHRASHALIGLVVHVLLLDEFVWVSDCQVSQPVLRRMLGVLWPIEESLDLRVRQVHFASLRGAMQESSRVAPSLRRQSVLSPVEQGLRD